MKSIYIFALCMLAMASLKSQSFHDLHIKEKYDDIFIGAYNYPPGVLSFGNKDDGFLTDTNQNYNLGQHGGVMESMLIMYETTKDKAYLYKFMEWTVGLFHYDIGGLSHSFLKLSLCESSSCLHFNARLLWPMAHFVYLVKVAEYNELYNEPIFDSVKYGNHATFGAFAELLYYRVEERLDWFLGVNPLSNAVLWIDEDRGFRHDLGSNTVNGGGATHLNFQLPWGMAMIYMYLSKPFSDPDHREDYGVKVVQLAKLYYNVTYDKCANLSIQTTTEPVLHYDIINNSYWWYHNGWNLIFSNFCCHFVGIGLECDRRPIDIKTEKKEDIGHGTWDIYFPILYNEFQFPYFHQHLTAGLYFEDYQMVMFRNTFTKNLYKGSNDFFMAVDATDGPVDGTPRKSDALGWTALYKFDDLAGITPNVYDDIIMPFYEDTFHSKKQNDIHLGNDLSSNIYKGLADLVAAQWDKECPNMDLTLKNRKVVYDQDFFAQRDLIVAPEEPNNFWHETSGAYGKSFADPIITDEEFIIEPGVTVNMKAANKIILKSGFHAKEGCYFRAYKDEDIICSNTNKMLISNNYSNNEEENINEIINDTTILYKNEDNISLIMYPNPNYGNFIIALSGSNENLLSIEITNLMGSIIYKKQKIQSKSLNIDISTHPKGIYFVKAFFGDKVFVEKIIYQ